MKELLYLCGWVLAVVGAFFAVVHTFDLRANRKERE